MRQERPEPCREPQRRSSEVKPTDRRPDGSSPAGAIVRLQRQAGNAAVSAALAGDPTIGRSAGRVGDGPVKKVPSPTPTTAIDRPIVQRSDPTAPTAPFELGGLTIATYADAAAALRLWCSDLSDESAMLTQGKVAVPAELSAARKNGLAHAELLVGGEGEALDGGNVDDIRAWHGHDVKAMSASQRAQSFEAAVRARTAADELRETTEKLEELLPALHEVQRARFRGGDEDGLLATADAIATVLDTGLVAKTAIEQTLEVAAELRQLGGMPSPSKSAMAEKVTRTLEVLEKINKAWAAFQLARVAVDLVSGSKTDMGGAHKGVAGMATIMSAGGTLLNASVGFTLYSNLYIGPMTAACLNMLTKLEDLVSKSTNRAWIELGKFDNVNWSLEPGGRKMFDFMLVLMLAGSPSAVPQPTGAVDDYFVDNKDDFSAGVGKAGGELPTEGWWLWEDTDPDQITRWAFKNRDHLWGMLYGAAKVPTGQPAF